MPARYFERCIWLKASKFHSFADRESWLDGSAAREKVAVELVCKNQKRSYFSVKGKVLLYSSLPQIRLILFSRHSSCLKIATNKKTYPVSRFCRSIRFGNLICRVFFLMTCSALKVDALPSRKKILTLSQLLSFSFAKNCR